MEFPVYLVIGALAGLVAGLLGVGGGLIVVPALAMVFIHQGQPAEHLMHLAIGTSLATIVPTAISSLLAHHRHGSVDWPVVRAMLPGVLLGGLSGAWTATALSSAGLAVFFGLFEILVALQLGFSLRPSAHQSLPGRAGCALAGGLIGLVSALLGIGGGTLTTPFLLWHGVDIRRAVGTSATVGLPIALAGAAGFVWSGWAAAAGPEQASGYVYWPAVLGVILASVPMAPVGARLAHVLPRTVLQRGFALFLLLVGIKMLLAG